MVMAYFIYSAFEHGFGIIVAIRLEWFLLPDCTVDNNTLGFQARGMWFRMPGKRLENVRNLHTHYSRHSHSFHGVKLV